MKVVEKKLEDGRIQLDCVATKLEVDDAFKSAAFGFAGQMGLQPEQGKTIAQVAEERMGVKDLDSMVEAQAAEYLVPFALDKRNLTPAFPPKGQPQSAIKRGREYAFRVYVTPKPEYELTSYEPLEVTVQPYREPEDAVDAEIEKLAEQFAEYVEADPHPVGKGDNVLIAMQTYKDDKEIPGLCAEGRTYVAGVGYMPESFDEQIIGMSPGETKTFDFSGPGLDDDGNEIEEHFTSTVTVKAIQKRVISEVTDEWVQKYMPMFKSVEELRKQFGQEINKQARADYDQYVRQQVASANARRFQGKIEDPIYEAMQKMIVNNLRMQLNQQGISWETYLKENGGEQQLSMMLMMQTRETLVQGFALDAVFRHEKLSINSDDINDVCAMMNPQSPRAARNEMEQTGRNFALRESAERYKANKWLVEHAIISYPPEKEEEAAE